MMNTQPRFDHCILKSLRFEQHYKREMTKKEGVWWTQGTTKLWGTIRPSSEPAVDGVIELSSISRTELAANDVLGVGSDNVHESFNQAAKGLELKNKTTPAEDGSKNMQVTMKKSARRILNQVARFC